MKTYLKFGSLIAVILGTILWLAMGGISETKTYYKTIAELNQLGDSGKDHRFDGLTAAAVGFDSCIPQIIESTQNVIVPKRREREAEPAFIDYFAGS